LYSCSQLDVEEVFAREGDAPFRRLAELLAAGSGGSGGDQDAEAEALRHALRGVAWTRSMRRMYTLVERCALFGV
jgi:midasin